MATTDVRFACPHDLELETTVAAVKHRRGRLRVAPAATLAETDNPEGGDHGAIGWDGGRLRFDRVFATPDGLIWHEGDLDGDEPAAGASCRLDVDAARRRRNAAYHSFSHLLTALYCEVVADDVIGRSRVLADRGELTLAPSSPSAAGFDEAWDRALGYLATDDPVEEMVLGADRGLALVAPLYRDVLPRGTRELRLVRVGHDLRLIPCRGVHVANLSALRGAHRQPCRGWDPLDQRFSAAYTIDTD